MSGCAAATNHIRGKADGLSLPAQAPTADAQTATPDVLSNLCPLPVAELERARGISHELYDASGQGQRDRRLEPFQRLWKQCEAEERRCACAAEGQAQQIHLHRVQ